MSDELVVILAGLSVGWVAGYILGWLNGSRPKRRQDRENER